MIKVDSRFSSSKIGFLVLTGIILLSWFVFSTNLDLVNAWRGETIASWVYHTLTPQNFIHNYPGLAESYDKTLVSYFYYYFHIWFGLEPILMTKYFILIEVLIFVFANGLLLKHLFNELNHAELILCILVVVFSYSRNTNFALFGKTGFLGDYYILADSSRLFAVYFLLKSRPILSGFASAITYTFHPVIGLIALSYTLIAGMVSRINFKKMAVVVASFTLLVLPWTLILHDFSSITSQMIPKNLWYEIAKISSFHWFPFSRGMFTSRPEVVFLPFLGLISFCGMYAFQKQTTKHLFIAALIIIIPTPILIALNELEFSVLLTKMSLFRSNDVSNAVAIIIAAGYVFSNNNMKSILIGSFILVLPFFHLNGFPPIAMGIGLTALYAFDREKNIFKRNILISYLSILLIYLFVVTFKYEMEIFSENWLAKREYWILISIVVSISLIASKIRTFHRINKLFSIIVVTLGFSWWLYKYHTIYRPFLPPDKVHIAKDFKQAQLWAKTNSDPTAVFMVDPQIIYGWRDFSSRSSFGNVREWLFSSWSYNGSREIFDNGINRIAEFDVDVFEYTKHQNISGFVRIRSMVHKRYLTRSDDWFRKMSEKYRVNYVVDPKKLRKRRLGFPKVFENENFIIYEIKTL